MNIGFVGLGIMGKPMAKHIAAAGYTLRVHDINDAAVAELVQAGATAAQSAEEAAAASDILILMLPSNAIVRQVVQTVAESAQSGAIVIDMSSTAPTVTRELAQTLAAQGISMLDAPVSGGEPKAIDGTLSIMAGGEQAAFDTALPVLRTMGKDVIRVGDTGSGATAKLANQIIVNVNIAAMAEALILAAKAGIDLEQMYQAIRGGLAGSTVLDAKLPMVLDRNFQAGGRIDINLKDLTHVMETAEALELELPLSAHVKHMFETLAAQGKQADDHGGLVQYYEARAGIQVSR